MDGRWRKAVTYFELRAAVDSLVHVTLRRLDIRFRRYTQVSVLQAHNWGGGIHPDIFYNSALQSNAKAILPRTDNK